jgi:Sulfotransferase domain
MPLEVIGTGFGRTGTESMRFALEILGFDPCHHMRQVYADDRQMLLWSNLVVGGAKPDWEKLFAGYRAAVDWPSALFWRELIAAFPRARIILTYRSAESWWNSYEKTLLKVISPLPKDDWVRRVHDLAFDGRPEDQNHCIAVYRRHIEEVRETVPSDRLLVHELGDGWPSLCEHLNVPEPNTPYPRSNAGETFAPSYRPLPE